MRAFVGLQRAPIHDRGFIGSGLGRARTAGDIGKGRLVRGDQAGAGAGFDGHVAEGHAALHRKRPHRVAGIFDDIAGAAGRADLGDDRQRHVLGRDAERQRAVHGHAHVPGFGHQQRLRGQHMLDIGGADAEGDRAEGAMGRGVGIAADDGLARQGPALLRPDDVDDALADIAHRQIFDAEIACIGLQSRDLGRGFGIGDALGPVGGRHIVVRHGQGQIRAAHRAAGQPEALEGLRARHLMDEMAVDIEHRGFPRRGMDQMGVPDLVVERLCRHVPSLPCWCCNNTTKANRARALRRTGRHSNGMSVRRGPVAARA